jgi:kumamolisin
MANGDRKVFADSVTPLPAAEGPTHLGLMVAKARPETSKEQMTVVFSLALPDSAQADLQKMVAAGRTASPAQLTKNYAADANDAKALTSWLKSQGFKIEKVSADRTSVYAQGTVEQIEKALNVNMVRVTKDGITYTAAQDAPSLPASVGKSVSAIVGLQPFRRAHKAIPDLRPAKRRRRRRCAGRARHRQRRRRRRQS